MITEAFWRYLQYEKRYSPHTLRAYRTDITQFFKFVDDVHDLEKPSSVTHHHVRSWMVDMLTREISPRTIRRKLSALKTYFGFLVRRKA
ncbi:MAG: site-specific integrase [Saprospiraceae bacterium]|nr:site-specific integrase [Saprospiraceae bacterium]